MKRIILSAILFTALTTVASAQTNTGGTGSRTTNASSSTGTQKKAGAKKGSSKTLNQRKEYQDTTGQTATPTGQEATGVNSSNAATQKDTTKRGRQR